MGIMPTKTEVALKQTQQGVSDEVLNIRVKLLSIHNDEENPTSANIKQTLRQVSPHGTGDTYKGGVIKCSRLSMSREIVQKLSRRSKSMSMLVQKSQDHKKAKDYKMMMR
ncbi:hypothetical protein Tco_0167318 [Tanacetum coccineum]